MYIFFVDYHEALKKSLENAQQYSDHVHVSITGLLLVYTKYIVHIVEVSKDKISHFYNLKIYSQTWGTLK